LDSIGFVIEPNPYMRIECDDVHGFMELKAENYRFLNPAINKLPWARQELAVSDPIGNKLIFYKL